MSNQIGDCAVLLRRINPQNFLKNTFYVGANRSWDMSSEFILFVTGDSTYNAPVADIKLLGYFIKSTYVREKDETYYTFRDSNGHENDIRVDYDHEGIRFISFFAEYDLEKISPMQVHKQC